MGLVEERNSYLNKGMFLLRKKMESITKGSELLRMSRIWEQVCEYLIWKQEKEIV